MCDSFVRIEQCIQDHAQNFTICVNLKNSPPKMDKNYWELPTAPCKKFLLNILVLLWVIFFFLLIDAHRYAHSYFYFLDKQRPYDYMSFFIFARYGYPIYMVSDKSSQFTSAEFKILLINHVLGSML